MNSTTKVLGVMVAILILAGGAYLLLSGTSRVGDLKDVSTNMEGGDAGLPAATDSIDDFSAAVDADLSATASAISAFDASQEAQVQTVVTSGNNLYDPENL